MKLPIIILFGQLISFLSKILNVGNGSTWPGHIALTINKNFIKESLRNQKIKIVLIAGTNGKTTTGKLIQTILETDGKKVFQNAAGANLLNGIASSIVLHSSILGKIDYDFAVFEIDENTLPLILKDVKPDYLLLLNLFRDQLDRYGEVNTIAQKWQKAISSLTLQTSLILNADDPQIAYLDQNRKSNTFYFGLDDSTFVQKIPQHAADSTYCPNCSTKLIYKAIYYSHVGEWQCPKCYRKRPKLSLSISPLYPLEGVYNKYNTIASVLTVKTIGVSQDRINSALHKFKPAFGRQEIIEIEGKKVQIFLSKNPTSFNESLRTVVSKKAKHILFVLNDRIPDGQDVSWIWDVDFEDYLTDSINITVSGDRVYDMGLRIKYSSSSKFQIEENLGNAMKLALEQTSKSEILYILPTYSAMLEIRRILVGRKIL